MGTRFPKGGLVMRREMLPGVQPGIFRKSRKSFSTKFVRTPEIRAARQLARVASMAAGERSVPKTARTPPKRARSISSKPEPQKGSQTTSSGKGPASRAIAAARGGWEAAGTSC